MMLCWEALYPYHRYYHYFQNNLPHFTSLNFKLFCVKLKEEKTYYYSLKHYASNC
jgi:hypothetical protein